MDEKISSSRFSLSAFSITSSQHSATEMHNGTPKEDLHAGFFFYTSCFLRYKFYISARYCIYDASFNKFLSKY